MADSASLYVREAMSSNGRTEVRIGELAYLALLEEAVGPGESMRLARRAVALALDTIEDEQTRRHMR